MNLEPTTCASCQESLHGWRQVSGQYYCHACGRLAGFAEFTRTGVLQSSLLLDAALLEMRPKELERLPPEMVETVVSLIDWGEALQRVAKAFEPLWARAGHRWNQRIGPGIFGAATWEIDADHKILIGGSAARVMIQIERPSGEYLSLITSDENYADYWDKYADDRLLIDRQYGYSRMGYQGVFGETTVIEALALKLVEAWPDESSELDALFGT